MFLLQQTRAQKLDTDINDDNLTLSICEEELLDGCEHQR